MKYNDEKIILIEYFNNIPHSVWTDEGIYDFETHANGWLMYALTGFGKVEKVITIEGKIIFPEKNDCKIWVDSNYTINLKYPAGIQLIEQPIELIDGYTKSCNPFEIGYEAGKMIYCKKCDAYYNEDGCENHLLQEFEEY